jgi:hypothetical protein
VLVTSKKKAMVVPGSTPPRNQELVPLRGQERREVRLRQPTKFFRLMRLVTTYPSPISFSETDGPIFLRDAQGPMAPAILNSLECRTSIWPPNPICSWAGPGQQQREIE